MKILDCFEEEAEALARIIGLAFDPTLKLTNSPPEEVVRLIAEALQSAYEANS